MSTTQTNPTDINLLAAAAAVLSGTRAAAARLAEDLRAAPPEVWSRAACGEWTVDQTMGHLVLGPVAYLEMIDQIVVGGQEVLFDVTDPAFADAQLEMMGEAGPEERLDSLLGAFGLFIDAAAEIPAEALDASTWTPEAAEMPVLGALAIGLNELVVHGFEVREAAGLPSDVEAPETLALRDFALHALTGMVQGNVPSIELRLSGGDPVTVSASGDGLLLGADDAEPVASITCSPAVLALLTWGRIDIDEAVHRGWLSTSGDLDAVRQLAASVHPF